MKSAARSAWAATSSCRLVSGIEEDSAGGTADRRAAGGNVQGSVAAAAACRFRASRELLQRFADDGFTLAVASSAKDGRIGPAARTSPGVKRSHPDPHVVGRCREVEAGSRHRPGGLEARPAAAPRAAVMMGDTPYDVEAARRAGLHVVAFECGGWAAADLRGGRDLCRCRGPAEPLRQFDLCPAAPSRHASSL